MYALVKAQMWVTFQNASLPIWNILKVRPTFSQVVHI